MKKLLWNSAMAVLSIIAVICLTGCPSKDPKPSKTDFLTGGTGKWKLTALEAKSGTTTQNVFNEFEQCFRDDIYYYKKDGNYQFLEGASKCDSKDPDIIEEGKWKFDSNETMLTTTAAGATAESVKIIQLDAAVLKVELTFEIDGINLAGVGTFTKQ